MERNLFEELADVTLMLYQVVYLLGCDEVVGEIANKKVKRTLERIYHWLIHKENNKMSKYGPGLSTKDDVCKLECKEAKRILKKYCVSKEDVKIITNMIKEAYFELGVAFQSGTATYKVTMELAEKLGIKEKEVFKRYMSYMSKLDEEAKND